MVGEHRDGNGGLAAAARRGRTVQVAAGHMSPAGEPQAEGEVHLCREGDGALALAAWKFSGTGEPTSRSIPAVLPPPPKRARSAALITCPVRFWANG
jgi:hypothetical protein